MSRTIIGLVLNRKMLNAPHVHVRWVEDGEEGHADFVDDAARSIVDATTGEILHAPLLRCLDELASGAAKPRTLTAAMTAASNLQKDIRKHTVHRDALAKELEELAAKREAVAPGKTAAS